MLLAALVPSSDKKPYYLHRKRHLIYTINLITLLTESFVLPDMTRLDKISIDKLQPV